MIRLAFLLSLACAVLACNSAAEPTPSAAPVDIRGTIASITPASDSQESLGTIEVEGEVEPDTTYDRAIITVGAETTILQNEEDGEPASFADLAVGQRVEVRFEGPVAESYPVQARAGEVIILEP